MLTIGTKDGHARARKEPLFEVGDGTEAKHHLWWMPQYEDDDGWHFMAGTPQFKSRGACRRWITELSARALREGVELCPMRAEPLLMERGKS